MMDRTDDGRPIKILTLIDVFTREALVVYAARRIRANDVIDIFADVMIERGIPEHIRSDNGPEIVAKSLRSGWGIGAQRHCTSSRAAIGRTATVRVSMASCAMSC